MASVSSISHAVVHVLDRNDNAPYFMQQLYTGEISEAAPVASLVIAVNGTHKQEQRFVIEMEIERKTHISHIIFFFGLV